MLGRLRPHLAGNLEAILVEIESIRAGRPLTVLMTSDYNPFVGLRDAPSATFGVDFYAQVAAAELRATCAAAKRYDARCVDVFHKFNGPRGTSDAKAFLESDHLHPNLAGRRLIADALTDVGGIASS